MANSENKSLLLQHMQWADAEVWKKVLSYDAAEKDERIKKLLYHLHQVQYAFYFLWNELADWRFQNRKSSLILNQ